MSVVGALAGELARRARAASWSSAASEQLAMAGVAIALFVFTEELGGSGFIAAFVGGLAAGSRLRSERAPALGFTDEEGAVVGAFVFFALGLFAVELFDQLTWQGMRLRGAEPDARAHAAGRRRPHRLRRCARRPSPSSAGSAHAA